MTKDYGVSLRIDLPAGIEEEFRGAAEAAKLPLKQALAKILSAPADDRAMRLAIVKGQITLAERPSIGQETIETISTHVDQDLRSRWGDAAETLQISMKSAIGFAFIGLRDGGFAAMFAPPAEEAVEQEAAAV